MLFQSPYNAGETQSLDTAIGRCTQIYCRTGIATLSSTDPKCLTTGDGLRNFCETLTIPKKRTNAPVEGLPVGCLLVPSPRVCMETGLLTAIFLATGNIEHHSVVGTVLHVSYSFPPLSYQLILHISLEDGGLGHLNTTASRLRSIVSCTRWLLLFIFSRSDSKDNLQSHTLSFSHVILTDPFCLPLHLTLVDLVAYIARLLGRKGKNVLTFVTIPQDCQGSRARPTARRDTSGRSS